MIQHIPHLLESKNICFQTNVPMRRFTTFATGGPADLFVLPKSEEEVSFCTALFSDAHFPFHVLGNGSNTLVTDAGIEGAVLLLGKDFSNISTEGTCVTAQAGAKLSALVNTALSAGLTGLEFAGGIPGTVGGGVYMNAGAYGHNLSEFICAVYALDEKGNIRELGKQDLHFGYRESIFTTTRDIVLRCRFSLKKGDVSAARQTLGELNARRRESQPLEYPSAGSTFKRPPGNYAGTLIDQSGLKGCTIGGAQVSEKHAGFIINRGGATSRDILALMRHVQKTVYRKSGIWLEPEVRILGRGAEEFTLTH